MTTTPNPNSRSPESVSLNRMRSAEPNHFANPTAFITTPYGLGAVWIFGALFGPMFNVSFSAYRYALVPDRLLARVGSVALVVAWGAIPLGQLTAGFLLDRLGSKETILWLAAAMATVAAAATASPSIRNAPRVEELVASA